MSVAYDTYDYPSYWKGRDYEHLSEEIALKTLLSEIDKIERLIDIGAGYGRLYKTYIYRAKRIVLTDPSSKLLSQAKINIQSNKVVYVQSTIESLPKKLRLKSFDVVLMVRVLHHINNIDKCFQIIHSLLKDNGYLILEFPNKSHFKANVSEFIKGNFTFPIEFLPKDINKKKSKENTLPFKNYHYDFIDHLLIENGFEIIDHLSVSNLRSNFIKMNLPIEFALSIERILQRPLSYIKFGPSIFLLVKKRKMT